MRKTFVICLLILFCASAYAQKRISADVEIKQLTDGKVSTITKSVYCANNGRLVVYFHQPLEYVMLTDPQGNTKFHFPELDQVMVDNSASTASSDELLSVFLFGRIEDLGLGLIGYSQVSSEILEDGLVRKVFKNTKRTGMPVVEIVYENYLPIFMQSQTPQGAVLNKTYLSKYVQLGMIPFPSRSTAINYGSKGDSTVVRTLYSNFELDSSNPMFEYSVPSTAKEVPLSELFKKQ